MSFTSAGLLARRALLSGGVLWTCACSEEKATPRTQLVLVAGTDIDALATVRFEVSQGEKRKSTSGKVDGDTPAFVNLLHQQGSLGPVDIVAQGLDEKGKLLVSRRARVSFVKDQTRVVPLHLLLDCLETQASCDAETETCTERGCRPFELAEDDLEAWTGTPPKPGASNGGMDASMPDDGGQSGGEDASGGSGEDASAGSTGDDGGDSGGSSGGDGGSSTGTDGGSSGASDGGATTCDGQPVDLDTDEAHCGQCDVACDKAAAHQIPLCVDGMCTYPCEDGFDDCTTAPGCESDLTDKNTCGSCEVKCTPPLKNCDPSSRICVQ